MPAWSHKMYPLLGDVKVLMDLFNLQIVVQTDPGAVEIKADAGFFLFLFRLQDIVQSGIDNRLRVQIRVGVVLIHHTICHGQIQYGKDVHQHSVIIRQPGLVFFFLNLSKVDLITVICPDQDFA